MIYDHPIISWIYEKSPVAVQHCLVTGYGLFKRWERFTPDFRRYVRELESSQWWSPCELEALQEERLRAHMLHAYENVPYYRGVFDRLKLRPTDIRRGEDLYKLPVLTKQDVRRHWNELRARNASGRQSTMGRTGGTTGVPLHFALDKKRVVFDHALIHRHWSWAGYHPGDRVVLLRGFTLVPPEGRAKAYWRYDRLDNRIYLSGFHLSTSIMSRYVEKLQEWQPGYLAGYPSNIFTLARFMEREDARVPVRAVFTSSEVLTPAEREVIEDRLGCKVWDRYGTGERLVVGQQCEYGSYHQNVEFGILQIDSPRGQPAPPGTRGELVQTGLTNLSMPLIRYASEDMGYLVGDPCRCGRGLRLMGPVEGRKDDVIVTSDGRLMPRAGLDQIHEFVETVERCQLVQERVGHVMVRVLPRPGFSDADVAELKHQLQKRLGSGTQIEVRTVEELAVSATGKERFILSKVDVDGFSGLHLEVSGEGGSP